MASVAAMADADPPHDAAHRGMPRILVLTYHEITKDARVAKQVRAAAAAGCEVTVLSDREPGAPATEEIDGVRVQRFRCLDPSVLATVDVPPMPFLADTAGPVMERLGEFRAEVRRQRHLAWFGRADAFLAGRTRSRGIGSARRLLRLSERAATRLFGPRLHAAFAASQHLKALVYATNAEALVVGPHDIVHAHDLHTLPAALRLAERFGARVVYDAHEYEPARVGRADAPTRALDDAFERACLRSVDAVVSVSDSICALYAERFDGPFPTLIMNVPEFGAGSPGVVPVRAQAGVAPGTPLVVFTGGVQRENRGLDKVLQALKHLEGVHLAVLGPRHVTNDLWLISAAARLGVRPRLHLLPPVPAADVPQAIASADAAICPIQDVSLSYRHAMPNKLFEAAFAGVPICVSDLPDMRRFVEDMGIGLAIDQTDPAAIAEGLRTLCANRSAYQPSEATVRRLAASYGWPVQVERLLALYARLAPPDLSLRSRAS